ncbi:hypothetical protein P168DRAFT_319570 [Aspergillus campestris IBT 28561]|uniref:Uncharacterized protein n=1 Tax=Aspergillus campestris (strain IBT 28561) TaxID=1392248 RepID=A0A2I1CZH2_ASPC2|nr:uncharacterized protein P168DRAFT_319570 [Aspergillus campestris IBT 28561]PKY03022.1 hypothetical protein P168DRAFT_319570 [Aspergillus campestris IBT 28561]
MKLFAVAFAIATSAVMVMAAPAPGNQLEPRVESLPGTCNGTRCNLGGSHYDCYRGTSCTEQAGAGDGWRCDVSTMTTLATCPGKGNYDGPTS